MLVVASMLLVGFCWLSFAVQVVGFSHSGYSFGKYLREGFR